MKITDKILSLPPYISTAWINIRSLHMNETQLVITLHDGQIVTITGLSKEVVDQIFTFYTTFMEQRFQLPKEKLLARIVAVPPGMENMMKSNLGFGEAMGDALQHNSDLKNSPDLPKEIIQGVVEVTKMMGVREIMTDSVAEPHCNCPHCQITRSIDQALKESTPNVELSDDPISEKDLEFEQWDIQEIDRKRYNVVNKLDKNETYQVFLGHPIGCTCGVTGCDHILTVLKS